MCMYGLLVNRGNRSWPRRDNSRLFFLLQIRLVIGGSSIADIFDVTALFTLTPSLPE